MTSHITKCTSSKINPTSPVKRMVRTFLKWTHRRWPYPAIPVEVFRNRIFTGRPPFSLWPNRSIGPNMYFCNISNCTTSYNFNCLTQAIFTCTLIPHLGHHTHLLGCLTHQSRLMDRPCQWLLTIHMFFHLHCFQCCNRMSVIWGANRHNIDLVSELLKHFSKIIELSCVRKLSRLFVEGSSINVT